MGATTLKAPFEKVQESLQRPSKQKLTNPSAPHRRSRTFRPPPSDGIPSLVLEAWSDLDTRLRATQYGVPATRVFLRAGLLPDFRAASIPKFPAICWRRVADGEKLIEIDMSVVADHEDRMTVLPLGEIIQIMYRHCVEKYSDFIEIRFNHKCLGVG